MNLAFSFRGPVGYIVGRKTGQDNVSRQVFTWRTGTSWRLVYQVWYCCASWLYVVAGCNFHSYVAIACCSSMILFAPLSYIAVLHCCTCTLYMSHYCSSPLFPSSKQVKPPGLSAEACKEGTRSASSLVRVDFLSTLALVHLAFLMHLTQVGPGYVPSTGWLVHISLSFPTYSFR